MLENLPKEIFSSFRIVYVAYVLLILLQDEKVNLSQFFIVSGILMFLAIIHDDYLRYKFNKWGKK